MELLQIACEILAVVNVVLFSLIMRLALRQRERKLVRVMRRERQLYVDTLFQVAIETQKFVTAKMIARITKKKMVLA
jgi:hypothetical protein